MILSDFRQTDSKTGDSNNGFILLRPPVTAVSVGTHVIKSHVCCSFLRVGLEEDRLPVATPGAGMVLRPGHRRVLDHVGVDVAHLIYLKQPSI